MRLVFQQDNGRIELPVGITGHFSCAEIGDTIFGTNASWRARNKLELEVRNTRMVTGARLLFQFDGSKLTLTGDRTVPESGGLSGDPVPTLAFTLQEGEINTKTKMYWEQ